MEPLIPSRQALGVLIAVMWTQLYSSYSRCLTSRDAWVAPDAAPAQIDRGFLISGFIRLVEPFGRAPVEHVAGIAFSGKKALQPNGVPRCCGARAFVQAQKFGAEMLIPAVVSAQAAIRCSGFRIGRPSENHDRFIRIHKCQNRLSRLHSNC